MVLWAELDFPTFQYCMFLLGVPYVNVGLSVDYRREIILGFEPSIVDELIVGYWFEFPIEALEIDNLLSVDFRNPPNYPPTFRLVIDCGVSENPVDFWRLYGWRRRCCYLGAES